MTRVELRPLRVRQRTVVVLLCAATLNAGLLQPANGCSGSTPGERVAIGASGCATYSHRNGDVRVGLCSIVASDTARTDSTPPGRQTYLNPDIDVARTAWTLLSGFSPPVE